MNYRILGKTNLKVSEIGLGGIPIQRVTQEDANILIDKLIEKGINFIDTARGYTISEAYFGNALVGKRDKFFLATKSMAKTYESMKEDINTSLTLLKTSYIDLYQMHNLSLGVDYSGMLKALQEAKEEGKIKHIGVTSHSLEFLLDIIEKDEIETIQFPYNFLETQAEELFKKAKEKNIGVICMKPFAGGAIEKGEISLKYILNNENISIAIPGMATLDEVEKNSKVIKGPFTKEELLYINKTKEELNNDFCRRCGYCKPCTVGIDIPSCFLFSGYIQRYHLKDWAIARYKTLSVDPSKCIECHKCEERCPYQLKIVEKLKKVVEEFKEIM